MASMINQHDEGPRISRTINSNTAMSAPTLASIQPRAPDDAPKSARIGRRSHFLDPPKAVSGDGQAAYSRKATVRMMNCATRLIFTCAIIHSGVGLPKGTTAHRAA